MIVSKKQQEANRKNAQQSTGPTSPAGKEAVRFNALTWGLRARNLMLNRENTADYQQLWDGLAAEWQPQSDCERHYLEQMSTSQWLLARNATSETDIYQAGLPLGRELDLLDRVSVQRTRLERSFTTALHELKQLQKERQARPQPQPAQAEQTAKTAPAPAHQPAKPSAPLFPQHARHPLAIRPPDL